MSTTGSATTNDAPYAAVKHVFVLMLENRSFDNIFAMSGIPGLVVASTSDSNAYDGKSYNVVSPALTAMPTDPGHEFPDVLEQLCGVGAKYPAGGSYPAINNSGFAANYATSQTEGPPSPPDDIGDVMGCFDTATQLPVIYQLATEFAVCDHWFSSLPGPTWPNRFFVHGASSAGLDHSPDKVQMFIWGIAGFAYPNGSIFDALTQAGLTWQIYNDRNNNYSSPRSGDIIGAIPLVSFLRGVHLPSTKSFTEFADDLQQPSYDFSYTFIEPHYGDVTANTFEGGSSQHPMDNVYGGEGLIKATYEAIRNSPLWNSSVLIIAYDEHGGFYDSVAPGPALAPADGSGTSYNESGFTFEQYGVRVPAIVVSPLIPSGTVDHTIYDHASVPATLEKLFGLKPLTKRDGSASNVLGLLSLSTPRTDCATTLKPPAPPSAVHPTAAATGRGHLEADPLPRTGDLLGFLGILLKTEFELSSGSDEERALIVDRFNDLETRGDAAEYASAVLQKVERVRSLGGQT